MLRDDSSLAAMSTCSHSRGSSDARRRPRGLGRHIWRIDHEYLQRGGVQRRQNMAGGESYRVLGGIAVSNLTI